MSVWLCAQCLKWPERDDEGLIWCQVMERGAWCGMGGMVRYGVLSFPMMMRYRESDCDQEYYAENDAFWCIFRTVSR